MVESIYPTRITDYAPISVEKYGGKAASLYRLRNAGFNVPKAWVIPCRYTFTRPKVEFFDSGIYDYYRYAVRSGAPVSMPGLLQTKLNVTGYDGLNEAINAVWDSWHTDHAKAYREAKGIPHNMGTGVIIQFMVDPSYAGVAFTADPSNPEESWRFNPLIEYVEGLGDKLVGGETQPKKVEEGSYIWNKLYSSLDLIHKNFGPSDVEWCISEGGQLYFVQQRPVKFAQVQGEDHEEFGKWLVKGRAIGAPVVKAVKLNGKPKDCALFVEVFAPELYPKMIEAPAIICSTGGSTCHASIIARELNKPAVSGISYSQYIDLKSNDTVVLDGLTGNIYKLKEGVALDKAKAISIERVRDKRRTPDFTLRTTETFNANLLLARFYYTLDAWAKGDITEERKNEVADEIGLVLCTYFYIACLCEARWARARVHMSEERTKAIRRLYRHGIKLPVLKRPASKYEDPKIPNREVFAQEIQAPVSLSRAIGSIRSCHKLFVEPEWIGAFGGKKWGEIAKLVLDYLEGNLSSVMFVDAAFNLKHNGGAAFDKFRHWMQYDAYALEEQLNLKAQASVADLVGYTRNCVNCHTVSQFCTQETIFKNRKKHEREETANPTTLVPAFA